MQIVSVSVLRQDSHVVVTILFFKMAAYFHMTIICRRFAGVPMMAEH